ncbi:MAG TPA: hypothetical protein VK633_12330, partial [Verrucomicrobiae bacterium]|nr:hypothetical protein [Verrucomicrobiae bacterium]
MQIRCLLGPAGSGKTYRCLQQIRNELLSRPEGPPLIFLAPKQATFQLERQLLEGPELGGFSRLRILSFERLARFLFEGANIHVPPLLSEPGRVMVLRANLDRIRDELTIFKSCAKRVGFAQEVSKQFREFQQGGLTPARLRKMAAQLPPATRAGQKLTDLARIFEAYREWLRSNEFHDADALLSLAADLAEKKRGEFQFGGIWFDGFAQLTPQERRLLLAVLPCAPQTVLAFCLENEGRVRAAMSPWMLVSETFVKCRVAIEQQYGEGALLIECLPRHTRESRFRASPALRHLERYWAAAAEEKTEPGNSLRVVRCADPETEAAACAREILRFVRDGGRYRETAILLRSLENDYPHILRRVFRRYDIPVFMDQRESVAHHPLAELTRGALRMLAFNWQHNDLFAALKSGLGEVEVEVLDTLENEALLHGWDGALWKTEFRFRASERGADAAWLRELNRYRESLVRPFMAFEARLGAGASGRELAPAVRDLWSSLHVPSTLERWSAAGAFHQTVWDQMNSWLDDVQLAFAHQHFSMREWIPIIEAGVAGLTVGIIPPVLDHV